MIYQGAADDLDSQFPRITLGLDHGKLATAAGRQPRPSGWPTSTAENQVLLKGRG